MPDPQYQEAIVTFRRAVIDHSSRVQDGRGHSEKEDLGLLHLELAIQEGYSLDASVEHLRQQRERIVEAQRVREKALEKGPLEVLRFIRETAHGGVHVTMLDAFAARGVLDPGTWRRYKTAMLDLSHKMVELTDAEIMRLGADRLPGQRANEPE